MERQENIQLNRQRSGFCTVRAPRGPGFKSTQSSANFREHLFTVKMLKANMQGLRMAHTYIIHKKYNIKRLWVRFPSYLQQGPSTLLHVKSNHRHLNKQTVHWSQLVGRSLYKACGGKSLQWPRKACFIGGITTTVNKGRRAGSISNLCL